MIFSGNSREFPGPNPTRQIDHFWHFFCNFQTPWVQLFYVLDFVAFWCIFSGVFSVIDDGRQASISYYNKWVAEVQKTVAAENLLVFNVKEGWPPLCHFLGLPEPLLPFPRTNDSNTKKAQYTKRKIKAYLTIVGVPILIGYLVFHCCRLFQ